MRIKDLLSLNTIDLNAVAADKQDVINQAVNLIAKSGNISDLETYKNGVFKREQESTTGVGEGIAIPHCKCDAVKKATLAAMVIKDGVDYDALDGEKVNLLFLIAAPSTNDNVHLEVLAKLSNLLMHEEVVKGLKSANSPEKFLKILDMAEDAFDENKANEKVIEYPKILAATACPTGIAHTYMAQESLENAAKRAGLTIKVETNGTGGRKNELTEEEIEHADAIIIAADAFVEMERFAGKHLIECSVSKAIHKPDDLIAQALDPNCPIYGKKEEVKVEEGKKEVKKKVTTGMKTSKFHTFYKHMMSGISHMIPFVVVGGIFIAISFIIDMACGVDPQALEEGQHLGQINQVANIFNMLGGDFAIGMMLPVMSMFIAYSIAGRPGLVSGFIGGMAAKTGKFSLVYFIFTATDNPEAETIANSSSGFLGAIVAGFIAGYLMLYIQKLLRNTPKTIQGLKSILIEPLLSALGIGLAMILINVPLSYLNIGLTNGLMKMAEMGNGMIILLAIIVSMMMATDMGGPINKASHYFTIMLVSNYGKDPSDPLYPLALTIMAAHIVALMTPPIGCALSTWLFPQKYKKGDRTTALADLFTGFCGITEGAIPYAAKDPGRIIPACMIGSGVGGVLATVWGTWAISSEGGSFSLIATPKPSAIGFAFISIIVGSLVTAFLIGLLKKDVPAEEAELKKWKGIPTQPVYDFFSKIGNKIKGNKNK